MVFASLIYLILSFSQPVLLAMASCYVGSGIAIRAGGMLRRRLRRAPTHPEHQVGWRRTPAHRVAIVGGDTLLARELQDLLGEAKPAPAIELISSASETAAVLGGDSEEAIPLSPLTARSLAGAGVAFLAGSNASSHKALRLNPADGPVLIDLTGALEDQPHARLRAPSAEPPSKATPEAHGHVTGMRDNVHVMRASRRDRKLARRRTG